MFGIRNERFFVTHTFLNREKEPKVIPEKFWENPQKLQEMKPLLILLDEIREIRHALWHLKSKREECFFLFEELSSYQTQELSKRELLIHLMHKVDEMKAWIRENGRGKRANETSTQFELRKVIEQREETLEKKET